MGDDLKAVVTSCVYRHPLNILNSYEEEEGMSITLKKTIRGWKKVASLSESMTVDEVLV